MKVILIDKEHTASFDVDPQNGFSELCPKELPVPGALEIVKPLNDQAKLALYRVASKDCHNPNAIWAVNDKHKQFDHVEQGSLEYQGKPILYPNVDIYWARHCEVGTFGHEFLKGLPKVTEYNFVANKGIENDMHPYGACYHDLADTISTGVLEFLDSKNIKTVIVGGLATDYCVKTTALQLKAMRAFHKESFEVIVNLSACRGIADETVKKAIEEMETARIKVLADLSSLELI